MGNRICPIGLHSRLIPKEPALITDTEIWTYRECDELIRGLCRHLETIHINPKTHTAFIAHKTPRTILLLFALLRRQAVACPLSVREPMEKLPMLLDAMSATHYLETENLPLNPYLAFERAPLSEESLATCLLTSGSSGYPKAVCHTVGNHFYNALGTTQFFSLNPSSRWLLSLPLFHVGGLAILFRIFLTGGAVVLSDLSLNDALFHHKISHLSLVPTQLIRLFRSPFTCSRHLRALLCGGAPLPSFLLKEALQREVPIVVGYGMTEMSSIITASKRPKSNHVGTILPYREFHLSPRNEILVQGKTLFRGYWDKESKRPIRPEGWFPTGDLGICTEEGNLRIIGRTDRLFISGGENIHPEEIESALCCIPGITAATVVPISDPEFGERPVAFIQDDTSSHTLESIKEALSSLLPSFKHPVRLLPYPPNDSLKMNYSHLRNVAALSHKCSY